MDQRHLSQTTKVTCDVTLAGDSSLCLFIHPVCPPDEAEKLPTWSLLALSTVCLLQRRTQTQPRDPKTRAISRSGQKQKLSETVKYSKGHLGDAQGSVTVSEYQRFLCSESWRSSVQKPDKSFCLSPVAFHSVASDYVESRSRKCSAWIRIAWKPETYSKQIFLFQLVVPLWLLRGAGGGRQWLLSNIQQKAICRWFIAVSHISF